MGKPLRIVWLYLFVRLIAGQTVYGQTPTPPLSGAAFCGTPSLPRAEALELIDLAQRAYQQQINSGATFQGITYVPIRPHILRRSDGSGGLSLGLLNQVMALNNRYYLLNGAGIQFYFAGTTPDYVDNDQQFIAFNDENFVANGRDATNALNQYYVNDFENQGLGGYAKFPADNVVSTRSFILSGPRETESDIGNRVIPHELGHTFSLFHTFEGFAGTELVTRGAGANCLNAGDFICDTPADPYGKPGANTTYQDGCLIYDPASTARDANGDAYSPSVTNTMSYYQNCTYNFTPGQFERMQQGIALRQSHTSYTLNAPPTNAAAPSGLTGIVAGGNVMITWQDNATDEMGYFVERSTSPDADFLPIGGVGPNGTTFTDTKATLNTTYYYRVHPSNATINGFSPIISVQVTVQPLTGLRTTSISANAATLNWNYAGDGYSYDIQWRPVGSTTWNTIPNWYSTSYYLSNLTLGVTYEWQAKITVGTTYTGPITFTTTTCPVPVVYSAYANPTSASFNWESTSTPRLYTLQFRQQNTPTWSTIEPINTSYYSLTGLTTQTAYDWRVRATCGGSTTIVTDYSPVQSFTTPACSAPTLTLNRATSSSISLYWNNSYYVPNSSYALRYRPVGAGTWTTVGGLTTTSYSVTGLTANVPYEIQVATNCSTAEQSDFSASLIATPACQSAENLRYTVKATSAQLIWNLSNFPESGTSSGLQYRPAGSTVWSNVISISMVSSGTVYSLTGLATNTTYEWRVQINCPAGAQSAYVLGPNFSTGCYAPSNLSTYAISTTKAELNWYANAEAGTLFDLRYRVAGSANWTALNNLTLPDYSSNFRYLLTGLTNNTTYEWQVRMVCSPTNSSGYTAYQYFTTTCQTPPSPYAYNLTVSSASLSWGGTGAGLYELRYREVGTVSYTNVSSLTTSFFSVTGLTANTPYEWQVRSQCDGNVLSDFSTPVPFTTPACTVPLSLYTANQTGTSASLRWFYYDGNSDSRYEVRYRMVGAPDWTTVSSLTTTGYSGQYTLTGLIPDVPYEWQIRTMCSATETSAFSASILFNTCSQLYTLKVGSWTDYTVWSCQRVPTATDLVQIKHTVTVPGYSTVAAGKVVYDPGQTVIFLPGAKLRLGQ